jgi:anti-anti-sigma regulatory factor
MAKARGVFHVARCDDTVYVRLTGLGTMQNALTFRAFGERMSREGFERCVVDLVTCDGVDSTFMGVLVGLRQEFGGDSLVILNANAHCMKQMSSVGLDHVLTFGQRPQLLPDNVELTALPAGEVSVRDRLDLMRKAHKDLVAIDRRNRDKFGAFLAALDEQLGRGT